MFVFKVIFVLLITHKINTEVDDFPPQKHFH